MMTLSQLANNINEYLQQNPEQANLPLHSWRSYDNLGFKSSTENLIDKIYFVVLNDKIILDIENF